MKAEANIKYLRISPKKVKYLASELVGLTPGDAINLLLVKNNKASRVLRKVIESAKANAVTNSKMDEALLEIGSIEVNKGPIFKRWRAVSRGRAHAIQKKTTNIKIVIKEKGMKSRKKEKLIDKDNKTIKEKNIKKKDKKIGKERK